MDAREALETHPVSISPTEPPAAGLATSRANSPATDARRWELVDGLLVLSRPEGAGGVGERLVATLAPCPCPGCVCDTLDLRMSLVRDPPPEGDASAAAEGSGCAEPGDCGCARIALETGTVLQAEVGELQAGAPAALAWLREALDGELLDHLWELRHRMLGREPEIGWDELFGVGKPDGEPVNYGGVFLDTRTDCYELDGRRFVVDDAYFIEPGWEDDDEVSVEVLEEAGEYRWLGCLDVSLSDGAVLERSGPPEDEVLLDRIWAEVQARHRIVPRFRERLRRLRELRAAPRPTRPMRKQVRVGRNDPCPCGSGKKHKRCCGA